MLNQLLLKVKNEFLRLKKSEFARNVFTVFAGISFSQIIPIFVSPILTRLYTPEEFGILALFMSTGMIFGNIATFQYDAAIMLPKEDKDAINLLALALILSIFMSLFSLIIVVLLNQQLTSLMNNDKVGSWLYLVPISVFLTGFFRSFSVWSSRKKLFKIIAARNITQTATTAGSKLAFGFGGYTSGGLIIGSLIGQLISTSYLVLQSIKITLINFKNVSLDSLKINAVKYRDFPLFTNWQGFFDIFNATGSRYIISNFFGATILGWYSFTFGLLQRPLQLIGSAVSQVFYQNGAERYSNNKDLSSITKKILLRISIVGILLFIPIMIFGEQIFQFIFGEKWATAGLIAQIFTPYLFVKFVNSPLTSIFIIVNKQKIYFIINLIKNTIVIILLFIIANITNDYFISLIFYSISLALFAIINLLLILKYSKGIRK